MSVIKAMVVDDSAVVRQTLTAVLNEDPQIEVVAVAADPIFALKKLETITPDIIILDIEMPRMDGLTFLQKIMQESPLPVLICSSKSETGSQNALQAMEYGAVDIIQKPKMGTKQFLEESKVLITDAVKAAAQAKMRRGKERPAKPEEFRIQKKLNADAVLPRTGRNQQIETTEKFVVVGASTGGTEAIRIFLEMMPTNAPAVVIVQHMPEKFTAAFAQRLNTLCRMEVKEAQNNESVLRGKALIAPGNLHTMVKRSGARYYVEVKEGPLVSRHRPSVDVLFRSASRYGGSNVIAVIMTGMGDDGANGMVELNEIGAYTIAQDEASSIVFGMPREAIERNAIHAVLPLDKIAEHVLQRVRVR